MQDDESCEKLREEILEVDYSQDAFEYARDVTYYSDHVRNALHTLVEIDMSFNSARKAYSNRKCRDYGGRKYDLLWHVHKNIKGVRIENMDALELIKGAVDQKGAFMFLDPPYRHEYRGKSAKKIYGREMETRDHEELLEAIKDAECSIMLCGYRSREGKPELYDQILSSGKCGSRWHCYLLAEMPVAGIREKIGLEYVWVNYKLPKDAPVVIDTHDVMQHWHQNL